MTYRSRFGRCMTATPIQQTDDGPLTGHRRGQKPDEPRNSTVCCTLTETEKKSVDGLSHCINLRRSAILTEIVTRFMTAAQSPRGAAKRTALLDFLEECQEKIQENRAVFDTLTKGE